MSWRVQKMCDNCPFRPDDAAIELADGRLEEIKEGAVIGQPFHCHKTVYRENLSQRRRSDWKECAGAISYRERVWRDDPDAVKRTLERLLLKAKK